MPPLLHRRRFCTLLAGLGAASNFVSAQDSNRLPRRLPRTDLLAIPDQGENLRAAKTAEKWVTRRKAILAGMQEIMGPLPETDKKFPPDVRIEEEQKTGTVVRRRITYAAGPGERVPAWLLIPEAALLPGAGRDFPGALALHQTRPEGPRIVAGLDDSPEDAYGLEMARLGWVVLAPAYPHLAGYVPDLTGLGYVSGTMKGISDNRAGLDLLESLPFVRLKKFAAIGHSLGGHNGVFTAAFDPRIAAVASSCGLDSFTDYYGGDPVKWTAGNGWCQERYMPKLSAYRGRLDEIPFDLPEVIAAIAPRAVFISAPLNDSNFRWRSVEALGIAARPVFALHGNAAALHIEHPECGHAFPQEMREKAIRFLESAVRA